MASSSASQSSVPMSFAAMQIDGFLDSLGAKQPTPGGGAAVGVAGATGMATAQMAIAYSVGKKNLAEHEATHRDAINRLERGRALLLAFADEDAAAYAEVNRLQKLPEGDPARVESLPRALRAATDIPLAAAAACLGGLRLMESVAPITNKWLRSDLAIGAQLVESAARGARWNVLVNVPGLSGKDADDAAERLSELDASLADAKERLVRIEQACLPA